MTAALAGSLAGYYPDAAANSIVLPWEEPAAAKSHPHIGIFSFAPVQELIKASRKMRDFWAGSWVLHYLSAKVCWELALKYGPDTLLYPCLYAQPLIDHWLRQRYPDFAPWLPEPSPQALLTAGFPNVLVMILPDNGLATSQPQRNPVQSAMANAERALRQTWQELGEAVRGYLDKSWTWMSNLNSHTWDDWLKHQWQFYSVALPIGDRAAALSHPLDNMTDWADRQNAFAAPEAALFSQTANEANPELDFFRAAARANATTAQVNIGSWWPSLFQQTRHGLSSVKNARTWKVPTAFGPRSSVSGVGPVVAPGTGNGTNWIAEGVVEQAWQQTIGLFDGIEALNATEVLKRGLHKILPKQLFGDAAEEQLERFRLFYPDLSAGAAGWLRQMEAQGNKQAIADYQQACEDIRQTFRWTTAHRDAPGNLPWGIPWIVTANKNWPNPRLLSPGWLIDDYDPTPPDPKLPWTRSDRKRAKQAEEKRLRQVVEHWFQGNNPTDWYVLAAGDGDGMGEWLSGSRLDAYGCYVSRHFKDQIGNGSYGSLGTELEHFLAVNKRMGPASHSALSRALLDFSNRLVPYLTECRYSGRLIYSGGDDVLAYTNLWEWDRWLWDIRQCFRGGPDRRDEFDNHGNYWCWKGERAPAPLEARPLFTMGNKATVSFGLTIAHHSVPLAIALENLWQAEEQAKAHQVEIPAGKEAQTDKKDAVQVRLLFGNGNCLSATGKFAVFEKWQTLLQLGAGIANSEDPAFESESALFEQAAQLWEQHPVPVCEAIDCWSAAFCSRREQLSGRNSLSQGSQFQTALSEFLRAIWDYGLLVGAEAATPEEREECCRKAERKRSQEVQNWLKLAAFVLRNRKIQLRTQGQLEEGNL